jgi:hypothetical protein
MQKKNSMNDRKNSLSKGKPNLNENNNGRGVNQFNINEEKQNLYNDKSHFNDADLFDNHELKNGPNIDKHKISSFDRP